MSSAWASPVYPVLTTNNTPLPFEMTVYDVANAGAVFCAGGVIGTIMYGFIADYFGRKISVYTCAIPFLLCWALKIVSTNVWHLLLARFIVGLSGGGVFVVIPIFSAEISDDKIRGVLGAIFSFSVNIGFVLGYVCGGVLNFYVFAYVILAIQIIFLILFYHVPDTPSYLLSEMKYDEANEATNYFRGHYIYDDERLSFYEKFEAHNADKKRFTWSDFSTKSSMKGIIIFTVTLLTTSFCGMFVINVQMATIFAETNIRIEPNLATIIVSIIQMCGTGTSTILVDRVGRRILLLYSSFLTGLSILTLAGYMYLMELGYDMSTVSWLPIVALGSMMYNASWGLLPVPYCLAGEVLPQKIRGIILSAGLAWTWVNGIFMLKYFYITMSVLGLHGCMSIFGTVCLIETIFVYFYVPETKGKSIAEIEVILSSKKK